MTTAENLNRIIQAKTDIKQAIENKGVTVGDMTIDGYAAKINEIPQEVTGKWVIPNGMKFGYSNLTNIDIENMDFSNVIDMGYMFDKCSNLTSLDVSNWDTSKVNNMQCMFFQCFRLTEIKGIENWDTNKVTTMNNMFSYCSNLTSFDFLKNWDTSNVTDMSWMFMNCSNLTSVDLSNWDTSKVTDMGNMFYYCSNLTEVKMGGDISKVRGVDYMFSHITTTGTFYYNPQYDYSKIIAQLPSTWTAVPME